MVVDNGSSDGAIAEVAHRGVRLIANSSNRGFAAAVNQGFAALDATYVLVLNPDAVLRQGLDALRAACDLPGAAGAGGLLLGADGRPQVGFMVRSLPTPAALIWLAIPVTKSRRNILPRLRLVARGGVRPCGAFARPADGSTLRFACSHVDA